MHKEHQLEYKQVHVIIMSQCMRMRKRGIVCLCMCVCVYIARLLLASIQGRLKYGLVPIAGVIVRMRFKLPRIWVIVLRT